MKINIQILEGEDNDFKNGNVFKNISIAIRRSFYKVKMIKNES